jgi:hypothetical protein
VQQSFLDGVAAGSWVAAAASVAGALVVLAFLPAQHRAVEPVPELAAA